MKSILVYSRPWNEKQFVVYAENAFPESSYIVVSDFPEHSSNFLKMQIENLEENSVYHMENYDNLDVDTLQDIVARCRLLRNIDRDLADRLVYSAYSVINEIFEKNNFTHFISLAIDSYVLDLMHLLARSHSVGLVSIIPNFINGYTRMTSRGERSIVRSVTEAELDVVFEKLVVEQEKPTFLNPITDKRDFAARFRKEKYGRWLKKFYYKLLRFRNKQNYYCYHNWSSELVYSNLLSPVDVGIFEENITTADSNSIFLPLQYVPECTVDYWVPDVNFIDYYSCFFEILDKLTNLGFIVKIKEHPNCVGIRPVGFYNKILENRNALLISPAISSNQLIQNCEYTFVWTGTAGAEAFLQGKPVIHVGEPYYCIDHRNFITFDDFIGGVRGVKNNVTDLDKKNVIRSILEGCIKGSFHHTLSPGLMSKQLNDIALLGKEYAECKSI